MKTSSHYHNGHRQRMYDRIQKHGSGCLENHELLEMLLFYAIPRVNTNEIAHELLARFGSLEEILRADEDKLRSVSGIGDRTVAFLSLLHETLKRVSATSESKTYRFDSMNKVGEYLTDKFSDLPAETFGALFLDGQMRLLRFLSFSVGSEGRTDIDPKLIVLRAAKDDADCVILAHNHPNGYVAPSENDLKITKQIRDSLSVIGVQLVEHIIVSKNSYIPTMSESPFSEVSFSNCSIQKKFYANREKQ